MTLRVGIDVGGTNTDAVVVDGERVLASLKHPTTPDVLTGVARALDEVVQRAQTPASAIDSVVIGTTHFVNAVTEGRRLTPVVALRVATPPQELVPATDWPDRLREAALAASYVVTGGHQYDGSPLNPLDESAVVAAVQEQRAAGHHDYVVTSVFSPVNPACEERVAELVTEHDPDALVTMSHEIGRVSILERENAALLNGALRRLAHGVVDGFVDALADVGLDVPLYLSQNDGTLMGLEVARRFPIFTVASGPTNSMRGAALGSGLPDCVVVDVGGTTADIGLLRGGFPRESGAVVDVGGVRTNFRMPDVVSLPVGGGTIVRGTGAAEVTIGPDSVGNELLTRSLVFGGDILTLTDVAVAAGHARIGDAAAVQDLDPALVAAVLDAVAGRLAEAIDQAKVEASDVTVVAVGGGAMLVPEEIPGVAEVVRPADAGVANAIGAAMAEVGGEVDRIYALEGRAREEIVALARGDAEQRALDSGAAPGTLRVVESEDIPLNHLPEGTAIRVRVKVVGDLTRGDEATEAGA